MFLTVFRFVVCTQFLTRNFVSKNIRKLEMFVIMLESGLTYVLFWPKIVLKLVEKFRLVSWFLSVLGYEMVP